MGQRLREGLSRLLARGETLADRRGRPRPGPWIEICGAAPAWRILVLLPSLLAELHAREPGSLERAGLVRMGEVMPRSLLAARVASIAARLEREERAAAGDGLVTALRDEVAALRTENERLRAALNEISALAFAEAEAREQGAPKALPPPDPAERMAVRLDDALASPGSAPAPLPSRAA